MNREIEFRGKAINRKDTWFVGDLRRGKNGEAWIFPLDQEPGIDKHRVDPATVGQYTGLKDKDGVKVFEGDKVQFSGNCVNSGCDFSYKLEIVYYDGCFAMDHLDGSRCNFIPNPRQTESE